MEHRIKKALFFYALIFAVCFRPIAPVAATLGEILGAAAGSIAREALRAPGRTDTRIHIYANVGNLQAVKRELARGVPVDIQDRDGNTPLIQAASGGRLSVVKLLLERGARINYRNRMGLTALQASIIQEHDQTPLYLIRRGADVSVGLHDSLPLHSAIIAGKPQILRALLDAGSSMSGMSANGFTISQLLENRDLKKKYGRRRMAELSAIIQNAQANAATTAVAIKDEALSVTVNEEGTCEVFRGAAKTDSEPCRFEARANMQEYAIHTYQWPSGAKTVIELADTVAALINGQPVTSIQAQGKECYLNNTSGNTFCYRSARTTTAKVPKPDELQQAAPALLHGNCQRWKDGKMILVD